MPLRFHKEIKLGDFIKININKKSMSLSAGVPGLHFNIGPQGPMINVDLPGGASYRHYLGKPSEEQKAEKKAAAKEEKREAKEAEAQAKSDAAQSDEEAPQGGTQPTHEKRERAKAAPTSQFPPPETVLTEGEPAELPPTPSRLKPLLAAGGAVSAPEPGPAGVEVPPEEQPFQLGFTAYQNRDFINANRRFTELITTPYRSDALFMAGITAGYIERDDEAVTCLGMLLEEGQPPFPGDPDSLVTRYLPGATITVQITQLTAVDLPLEPTAALLLFVEWLQLDKQLDTAAAILEQVFQQNPAFRLAQLSLADVYFEQGRYDDIYNLFAKHTPELEADDDVAVEVMYYWALSLSKREMFDAADKVYRRASAKKKGINPQLRRMVQYGRADLYERRGKPALARKFFEKVLAEDPAFFDVQQRIAALGDQEAEKA